MGYSKQVIGPHSLGMPALGRLTMTGRMVCRMVALSLMVASVSIPEQAVAKPASKPVARNHIEKAAHVRIAKPKVPRRSMLGDAKPDLTSFLSNGRKVRVEVFRAAGLEHATAGVKRPAVMMLHGAGGIGGGMMIYPQAKALAARGISAFVVSYYDGLPDKSRKKDSAALFDVRDRVIEDALSFIMAQPDVKAEAVGVFGLSLGGFHGISLAARDFRVAALVNVFGAVPQSVSPTLNRLPPTLIFHGDKDRIVPINHSRVLSARLDKLGVSHELVVYKGQGHCFNGVFLNDSIQRTTDFFESHLNAASEEPVSEAHDEMIVGDE
jgi:carboxymethylenebutenolidase